jgi:hypothetical protein
VRDSSSSIIPVMSVFDFGENITEINMSEENGIEKCLLRFM